MMNALGVALRLTISQIADDWGWAPCRIAAAMVDLCEGAPAIGITGFVRPQLQQDQKLMGYWTM